LLSLSITGSFAPNFEGLWDLRRASLALEVAIVVVKGGEGDPVGDDMDGRQPTFTIQ
jgi:hypothetical protein